MVVKGDGFRHVRVEAVVVGMRQPRLAAMALLEVQAAAEVEVARLGVGGEVEDLEQGIEEFGPRLGGGRGRDPVDHVPAELPRVFDRLAEGAGVQLCHQVVGRQVGRLVLPRRAQADDHGHVRRRLLRLHEVEARVPDLVDGVVVQEAAVLERAHLVLGLRKIERGGRGGAGCL